MAPKELSSLRRAIPDWLEDAGNGLTLFFRQLLQGLYEDLYSIDKRMVELEKQIAIMAQQDPIAKRLQQLRGVGPLIAAALIATMADAKQYRKDRDMALAIGLTPRHHSSGGKDRLLGRSKREYADPAQLLAPRARSAMRTAKDKDDRLSRWITSLQDRRHANAAVCAMANKMVRMAWAMMTKGVDYDPDFHSITAN